MKRRVILVVGAAAATIGFGLGSMPQAQAGASCSSIALNTVWAGAETLADPEQLVELTLDKVQCVAGPTGPRPMVLHNG